MGLSVDPAGRPVFEPVPATFSADLGPAGRRWALLAEVAALDPTPERRFEAEALYRRAMLARALVGRDLLERQLGIVWKVAKEREIEDRLAGLADDQALVLVAGEVRAVTLPADYDVLALLGRVVERFPRSVVAEQALAAIAAYRQERGQLRAALAAYDELLRRSPEGPPNRWVAAVLGRDGPFDLRGVFSKRPISGGSGSTWAPEPPPRSLPEIDTGPSWYGIPGGLGRFGPTGLSGLAAVLSWGFADTALWLPSLETGEDGRARARIHFPDDLTGWRIRAHAVTAGTSAGFAKPAWWRPRGCSSARSRRASSSSGTRRRSRR